MPSPTYTSALIVGAGQGLSAPLTRLLRKKGLVTFNPKSRVTVLRERP